MDPTTVGGWRLWLLALLLVAGLVFAAFHWGDLKRFAELVGRARPLWLSAALVMQLSTYVLLSIAWSLVLRAGNSARPLHKLLPLTITKLFADQVVPTAGVGGNVLLVDRLTRIGVPRKNAVAAVILAIIGYYASYSVCALAAIALLALHGGASVFAIGIVGLFLIVAAGISSAALWLQRRGEAAVPRWLAWIGGVRELFELVGEAPRALVRDRRLIVQLTLLNGVVFIADALTMQFCLLALGQAAPFAAAFVPFIMASIVVTLGPIPLGLGSFEAVCIGMLRLMGLPFEAALSATLLFRGFVLWLPLAAGMVLMRGALKRA
jgi:uncharacterized protein (TIRG00374 family)